MDDENKMFCNMCGTELSADATYCHECGKKFEVSNVKHNNIDGAQNDKEKEINKSEINIGDIVLLNIIPAICFIIGIILFIIGLCIEVPSDSISSYSVSKYINGDAYNYMIEASLRGGKIAGVMISKCVYIVIGLLISCISSLKFKIDILKLKK